jgi:hypothetical protein
LVARQVASGVINDDRTMRGELIGVEHQILAASMRNGFKNDARAISFQNKIPYEPTGRFDTLVEANLAPVQKKSFQMGGQSAW